MDWSSSTTEISLFADTKKFAFPTGVSFSQRNRSYPKRFVSATRNTMTFGEKLTPFR
jgi:hypothetical protein